MSVCVSFSKNLCTLVPHYLTSSVMQLSKIDARIMRNVSGMQQLEVELEPSSTHYYQLILVPLVKSFMRACLEDLAKKDATHKSDAAREAFLAELALDSKKGIGGGTDTSRHLHEKSKEKKKNKDYRKTKEFKATGSNELHMLHHETVENTSLVVAFDGDHPDSGIVVTGSGLDLNQQEEELGQRKIELEAEERKLEETLEYQRRIENEAKQKHLAEQHKKTALAISEKKEAVGLPDDCFPHIDNDQNVFEQLKHSRQEPSSQSNGFMNVLELVPGGPGDEASQRMDNTHTNHHDREIKQRRLLLRHALQFWVSNFRATFTEDKGRNYEVYSLYICRYIL